MAAAVPAPRRQSRRGEIVLQRGGRSFSIDRHPFTDPCLHAADASDRPGILGLEMSGSRWPPDSQHLVMGQVPSGQLRLRCWLNVDQAPAIIAFVGGSAARRLEISVICSRKYHRWKD